MQKETKLWLQYSQDNLDAAKVLLISQLYNPCLHNIQQSVEKALKSLLIEKNILFKKTHSILELKIILEKNNQPIEISEDECDFLDSIYLPSKYPIGSALPDFNPDENICKNSIIIAERILFEINDLLK
ncbi:MAG: HEPN domain-containing protein [Ignavibacteriae bacterium]|nr:HEPN domain-containing protein [Ignavibacteriota bacterium]